LPFWTAELAQPVSMRTGTTDSIFITASLVKN
jgi:hypothetical protein